MDSQAEYRNPSGAIGGMPRKFCAANGWMVEASSFPSVFKEGWLRDQIKCREASLDEQTRWLVKSNSITSATRAYKEAARPLTNHPVCVAEERDLLIEAQPPLLANGGEWAHLATTYSPPSQMLFYF